MQHSDAAQGPIDPSIIHPSIDQPTEARLRTELSELFAIDTQAYLQAYLATAQQLHPQTWQRDIQELYRAIHTIKGGAVTVGAEAVLPVAIALENILSDLRYLETAPDLNDQQLSCALLEAGELLASTVGITGEKSDVMPQIQPALDRVQAIYEQVRDQYCPQWDESTYQQQDFFKNGFDLVVLDLEMALEQLIISGSVPVATVQIASETLDRLSEIGQAIALASGWQSLLTCAQTLLEELDPAVWQAQWPAVLKLLKRCAQQGGVLSVSLAAVEALSQAPAPLPASATKQAGLFPVNYSPAPLDLSEVGAFLDGLGEIEAFTQLPAAPPVASSATAEPSASESESVQISVALEKLDRLAQHTVAGLLAGRVVKSRTQSLQHYATQLVSLSQEGVQYIARLRQLQDDYTLLNQSLPNQTLSQPLGDMDSDSSPERSPERYRQGYTAVNRLLEMTLRLSEIGAETEKILQQTHYGVEDLDSALLNLQRTVEESRLVSFRTLSFRARTVLRELIVRYGKSAQLQISGEQIDLDVGSARNLEPILLHLIRNAYAHGIERAAERQASGKSPQGLISLSLRRRGSSYLLELSDDGHGIDAAAIEAKARSLNLPLTQANSPAALLAVISQPGFSLETQINELAGRGVGMDVVATQVSQMGGNLSLFTAPRKGTTFSLQFSAPHLLVSCILVRSGAVLFAIIAESVSAIALFETLEASETKPVLSLLEYWRSPLASELLQGTDVCLSVAIAPTAQSPKEPTKAWLRAHEIIDTSDLLVKALPHPMVAPAGLLGVSIQPDGSLIPVLEGPAVAQALLSRADLSKDSQQNSPVADDLAIQPSLHTEVTDGILVVDDAILMRRRIEMSLKAQGYSTYSCADGLAAWQWLQSNPAPQLMITDIEMPGMDGFMLIERCRQAGMTMPILVVSSRLSEEWSDEAKRLGASDYLTKGFASFELIGRVETLLKP
jgi:chemotaxis protein histidine kinase CheA/CheY-like chemotaxis protein